MTDEERDELAEAIAGELEDSAWGIQTADDRLQTAKLLTYRIEHDLRQIGWIPPATTDRIFNRIHEWLGDMAKLPEHHINRSVLNSQMAELGQILADR